MQTHIGGWFGELMNARQAGFGLSPVSFAEMKAWAELTGREPAPIEVRVLRQIDSRFLSAMTVKDDNDG